LPDPLGGRGTFARVPQPTSSAPDRMTTSLRRRDASIASWRPRLATLLRRTFGLKRLHEAQDAVIAHVMAGEPTLALMPTAPASRSATSCRRFSFPARRSSSRRSSR
jgi:hypothetical protein